MKNTFQGIFFSLIKVYISVDYSVPPGELKNVEFGTVEKSLAKCPADPPSAGTWQYKSSVLGRYVVQEPGQVPT